MNLAAAQPELTCAPNGAFSFSLPIAEGLMDDFLGRSVTVNVDGLVFDVNIGKKVDIPPVCRSIHDAKYFAVAISFQVLTYISQRKIDSIAERSSSGAGMNRTDLAVPAGATCLAERMVEPIAAPPLAVAMIEAERGERASWPLPEDDAAVSFEVLFDRWREEHLLSGGAPTTPPHWETLIQRFVSYLGHSDPTRVTTQDVRAYRDHLIRNGRLLRTARHSDLAALRSLFRFGIERGIVTSDPTSGVRFRSNRLTASRKMLAFSDDEARTLLRAADCEEKPQRRWIPWLTALTGSRISTLVNLRKEDVIKVEDVWCLRITRQAGPIKTAASERIIPIHPLILERGFIQFVESCKRDRLFINRTREDFVQEGRVAGASDVAPYNPGRTTRNRLTEWIHSLGLDIGRSSGKDPNHAWRHWFKERAFEVGIPEKITDAIVGHAQASISRRYGSVSVPIMFEELKKIQDPLRR